MHKVSKMIGGKELTIETGRMAKQADGAVLLKYGDTEVLVTVVRAAPRQGIDYFPLNTDYREKTSAVGRFPGGFFKREGRPTTKETLTMRMMDRPVRPLFPEGYKDEVQIMAAVLSADRENDPDVLAVVGASASLAISPIPFMGPIGTVRVGRLDGGFIVNPTASQLKECDLNLVVSASREGVVMVEGEGREVDEEAVLGAIRFGYEQANDVISLQEELVSAVGVSKIEFQAPDDGGLLEKLRGKHRSEIEKASFIAGRKERSSAMSELYDRILEENVQDDGPTKNDVKDALDKIEEEVVRAGILAGKRPDGRKPEDIRQITCEVGILARTHGSALFTRGETQALAVVTLGTTEDEQKIDGLQEAYYKNFILHYNFPPFSVGEARMVRGPSRRDIGHGNLAERSLQEVLPDREEFPYTIRVVSDILESNGSSSMASVCGGTLALMDCGVPIKRPVAGIAMGLVVEGDQSVVLTDIAGAEDHFGDMDLKVAGTQKGITGLQMDIKTDSIKVNLFEKLLAQAKQARINVLHAMLKALPEPRSEISKNAPKLVMIKISPEMIGTLIGPRGKMIKALQEETNTRVEVSDDGTVKVSGESMDQVNEARERVKALTLEIKEGDVYEAKVVSIREGLGAFVEIAPGRDALLHVSEIANKFVEDINEHLKVGDVFRVKVTKVSPDGKTRVSKKALE